MKRVIGKINPEDRQVTIWGAGFSGLTLGHYLKNQGYKVTILERSNKVGGKIQTKKTSGGLIEKGAHALYLNSDGLELLKELKLEPIAANKKIKRLLMINGKPRRPFQAALLSKIAFNAYKKPPLISDGLTVAEFFKPLMGIDNVQNYMSPILSGIYAAPSERLHFRTVFHQVGTKAQFDSYWDFIRMMLKDGKAQPKLEVTGSVTFEGGMQTLINGLAETLKGDIKLNYKEPFKMKGNTIICTDALSASDLIKDARPDISSELARIRYQELTSVTLFMKREIKSLQKSFGVLIPLDSGYNSIGIINNKAVFPTNNENILSYTLIARKKLSNEDILADLNRLSDGFVLDDIDHIDNTHWDKALPIYDLQLYLSVKKLHQLSQKEENLAIFGNYVAGISLREMISAAKSFAAEPQKYS